MQTSRRNGFTLIELLVVIAIIGLLAAVVLAALAQARNQSRNATVQQELREIAKVMEVDYLQNKTYRTLVPNNTNILNTGSGANGCQSGVFAGANASKAVELCIEVINAQTAAGISPYLRIFTNLKNGQAYSISARQPTNQNDWFCIGSNGGYYEGVANAAASGCNNDPTLQ